MYFVLDLNHSAVSDEVGSGEVARIDGGEKRHDRGDFPGLRRWVGGMDAVESFVISWAIARLLSSHPIRG